ncbi:MAG: nuclear transport factor 2 family protein [Acidobacteriota bacterium]|nr:nuclear transport factor 2 family protein [Acidobacteriota bacterium]
MAEDTAKKFIDALGKLEAERDLETIASLFADDCEIGNVVTENKDKSLGARKFWQSYRDNFGEVKSTFRNQIIMENHAALEWTTTGTSSEGKDFQYDGVSVLEIDGDKISRFHAYFDPNKLGQQIVSEKTRSA